MPTAITIIRNNMVAPHLYLIVEGGFDPPGPGPTINTDYTFRNNQVAAGGVLRRSLAYSKMHMLSINTAIAHIANVAPAPAVGPAGAAVAAATAAGATTAAIAAANAAAAPVLALAVPGALAAAAAAGGADAAVAATLANISNPIEGLVNVIVHAVAGNRQPSTRLTLKHAALSAILIADVNWGVAPFGLPGTPATDSYNAALTAPGAGVPVADVAAAAVAAGAALGGDLYRCAVVAAATIGIRFSRVNNTAQIIQEGIAAAQNAYSAYDLLFINPMFSPAFPIGAPVPTQDVGLRLSCLGRVLEPGVPPSYGCVKGVVGATEANDVAAAREVFEETGLDLRNNLARFIAQGVVNGNPVFLLDVTNAEQQQIRLELAARCCHAEGIPPPAAAPAPRFNGGVRNGELLSWTWTPNPLAQAGLNANSRSALQRVLLPPPAPPPPAPLPPPGGGSGRGPPGGGSGRGPPGGGKGYGKGSGVPKGTGSGSNASNWRGSRGSSAPTWGGGNRYRRTRKYRKSRKSRRTHKHHRTNRR